MSSQPQHAAGDAPSCGLYRTTQPLDDRVEAGRLVYYHDHGDPGPGIYSATNWRHNRARFAERGFVIPDQQWAQSMEPLPTEGLYRVTAQFTCCERQCQLFEQDDLVQLGYNGRGEAILFRPYWGDDGLKLPSRGTRVDDDTLQQLTRLRLGSDPEPNEQADSTDDPLEALLRAPLDRDLAE